MLSGTECKEERQSKGERDYVVVIYAFVSIFSINLLRKPLT